MIMWSKISSLTKAMLISCLIHGLLLTLLFVQSSQVTPIPESAELYEMDLTQALPGESELPADADNALVSEPDSLINAEKEPSTKPLNDPQKSLNTPNGSSNPAPALQQKKPIAPFNRRRNISDPILQKRLEPLYPSQLAQEKQPFKITVIIEVLPSGQTGVTAITQSSGAKELDAAAILAIKQWLFLPAMDLTTGQPVISYPTVDLP